MVYYNDTAGGEWDWPIEDLGAAESAYRTGAGESYFDASPNLSGKLSVP